MQVDLIDIFLLLAAGQGFFLSVLIFHKHGKFIPNRFLGSLILGYSIVLFYLMLDEINALEGLDTLRFFFLGIAFLIAPSHYLYAKYLVQNRNTIERKGFIHLSGLVLFELFGIVSLFIAGDVGYPHRILDPVDQILPGFVPYNWAVILYTATYLAFILRMLRRHRQEIKSVFSSTEKVRLSWLNNITYMAVGFAAVYSAENILLMSGMEVSNEFDLSSLLIVIYVYAIGYMGFLKTEVFRAPDVAESMNTVRVLHDSSDGDSERDKYRKSGLSDIKADEYSKKLLMLMEQERPYTRDDLTLNHMAEMLSITPHNLSEIINSRLDQNFFDFVNQYRVEQVKKDLLNPEKQNMKVLAIAFDAGFRSKSSFNTTFKRYTNLTPSEFRRQHQSVH